MKILAQLRRLREIFWRFLVLGCTSFGGPTAHFGYFRQTFVERLRWMGEETYVSTIALCQFLPGPGSSQVGFAIGVHRAGPLGGLAAFLGFTLPSFLLMVGLATVDTEVTGSTWFRGCVDGLKLLAVAVVAHAVLGMARRFWRGPWPLAIGLATSIGLLALPGLGSQILVLLIAAVLGGWFLGAPSATENSQEERIITRGPTWTLAIFALLLALPLVASPGSMLALFADLARVGSLVFGGGHVVLPLLQASLDGVSEEQFLVGYAAAQGVPGPMFSLATYLGATARSDAPLIGAAVATAGIFLPGFLLVLALRNRWLVLTRITRLAGAFTGINAAVVGLLLAALVHPVFSSAVKTAIDLAIALGLFATLRFFKVGMAWLVGVALVIGVVRTLL